MNSIVVLILGLIVFFIGYRIYAKYIDTKVIQSDPKRATPAKMYMDGVEFMPTSKSILFGYQFKSIAGAAPIIGPIIAIQWGWLPALIWILGGAFFIGWVQDYSSAMVAMRNEGASFGGLSHKLISPRARVILLAFIYFYLLLIAGAFGNVVVSTAISLKAAPMAWLLLTIGGILAGQMIYKWKKDIILTTVVCVVIALAGAVMLWVAGFDILYSLQDEDFDRKHGLYSLPCRLGRAAAMRLASRSMWRLSSHSVRGSGRTMARLRRHSGGIPAKSSSKEPAPTACSISEISSGVCGR